MDVNGNQLNAVFLNDSGKVRDSFRIVHTDTPVDTVAGTDGVGTDGAGTDGAGTDGGGTSKDREERGSSQPISLDRIPRCIREVPSRCVVH